MSKLSRKIARKTKLSEKDVRLVLDVMNECIVSDLQSSGESSIPSLGSFSLQQRQAHYIRNVRTGERELTKPAVSVKFDAYKSFRDKCE